MRSIVPPLAAKLFVAASIKASTLATSKAGSAAFNSRWDSTTSTVSTPSLSISMVVLMLLTLGFLTGMASTPCGLREAYHSFRQERVGFPFLHLRYHSRPPRVLPDSNRIMLWMQ